MVPLSSSSRSAGKSHSTLTLQLSLPSSKGFDKVKQLQGWPLFTFDDGVHVGLRLVRKSLLLKYGGEIHSKAGVGNVLFVKLVDKEERAFRLSVLGGALEENSRKASGLPKRSRWEKVRRYTSANDKWKQFQKSKKSISRDGDASKRPSEDRQRIDVQEITIRKGEPSNDDKTIGATADMSSLLEDAKRRTYHVADYSMKQVQHVGDYLRGFPLSKYIAMEASQAPPLPPFTGSLFAGLGLFLLIGIVLETIWFKLRQGSSRKNAQLPSDMYSGNVESLQSRTPSGLGLLLDRDLRRKESVEWVNMVIGKLWNLYRRGLEGLLVEQLQPIIDDLQKPAYVSRVEVQNFFLGDDPLTLRTVERRTSRRVDDLQYHIGLRYTGGARMLLLIILKWGFVCVTIPVGVRGLDVDAELWVKMRMIPTDPWIGQATWAFVTLPKIKLALAPFSLFNIMSIPFLSIFLEKLLTEDLPSLFVRPNKNVVDFLRGRAVGPLSKDFKEGVFLDATKTFSGELSITLIEATNLNYVPFLKTDPYVIFVLGEQVIRSKKNSQTSIIGPAGSPVWNQDFRLLVVDQRKQHLSVTVHDTISFTSFPVGSVDINLSTLQDTVPIDKKLTLKSGWGPFPKRFAGELLLRLTYKAYVDEDEDVGTGGAYINGPLNGQAPGAVEQMIEAANFFKDEASKVAEFFQEKELAKDMLESLSPISTDANVERALPILGFKDDNVQLVNEKTTVSTGSVTPSLSRSVPERQGSVKALEMSSSTVLQKQPTVGDVPVPAVPDKKILGSPSFFNQFDSARKSPVLLWLALVTVGSWLVVLSLNLNNNFNP